MFIFPDQVGYECIQCGKSCLHWNVYVDAVESAGKSWRLQAEGVRLRLIQDERGRCLELSESNQCRIHEDKPAVCRQFPFVLAQSPDGVHVGVSFRCSAVLQRRRVEWSEHLDDLQALLARGVPKIGFEPVQLGPFQLDWNTYKQWEAHWLQRLPVDLSQAVAQTLGAALGLHSQSWERLIPLLSASAVGFLESLDHEAAGQVATAVRAEREFKSARRGWTAPIRNPFEGSLTPEGVRFLCHVIERKTLWLGHRFLGRLLMLLTAERMLLYYTRLEGFAAAVERLEGEWLLHRQDLQSLEQTFEDTLLQLL